MVLEDDRFRGRIREVVGEAEKRKQRSRVVEIGGFEGLVIFPRRRFTDGSVQSLQFTEE